MSFRSFPCFILQRTPPTDFIPPTSCSVSFILRPLWLKLIKKMLIFQITFAMAPWRILMLRHKTGSLHNSFIHYPICPIFLMLHDGSVLNTSVCQFCVILIASLVVKWKVLINPPYFIRFLRRFSRLMNVACSTQIYASVLSHTKSATYW